MKICFICNEYPPMPANGIGIFVQTLAEQLAAQGEEVWVAGYGRRNPSRFTQNGVRVEWVALPDILHRNFIRVNGYRVPLAALIRRQYLSLHVNRLVRSQKIDLVESHDFHGPLAGKPPCKLVVRLHGSVTVTRAGEGRPTEIDPRDKAAERRQVAMADHLVAVSRHIGAATNSVFGLQRPFEVIYNGIDTRLFSPNPALAEQGRILFAGNLLFRKGYAFLLQAAPLILQACPNAVIDFIGGAGGSHQAAVNAEHARLPDAIRARVRFLGPVAHANMPEQYNRCAVYAFPSLTEAFGLTCAEAMACARPIVATNRASGPELIQDGVTGLLVDPTHLEDLAQAVVRLLADPQFAHATSQRARNFALRHFSVEDLGPRNLAFYRSIL